MELKTKRLILRKPKLSDWKDVVEGVGDYEVAKMIATVPFPYAKKDADSFIKLKIKEWAKAEPEAFLFFIELKSEKKVIGAIEVFKVNRFNGTGMTGSWINKKYWRNGYMTEAKIAVNDFAFNKLKLNRLESTVFTDNIASNATQKKIGYVLEGVMRQAHKSKATKKLHDVNMYGLLKADWKKARHKLIK